MIRIGYRSEIKGGGIGNIPLETESSRITLQDVLYVPNIGSNLLSVAKTIDHGHSLLFTPSECKIQNTEGKVKGVREGNVYILRAKKVALEALSNADIAVSAETWHRCLGHRSLDGPAMASIQKAIVVLDVRENTLNSEDTRVCETCAIGRQHKETMTVKRKKVENLLECIPIKKNDFLLFSPRAPRESRVSQFCPGIAGPDLSRFFKLKMSQIG